MADNKKHHYVPQFYLRFFSKDGRTVSVLNAKRAKIFHSAPLRNQCYRDYFYGKDGVHEKALSVFEGEAAQLIKKLIADQTTPRPKGRDFCSILLYVTIQANRTGYRVDALNDMCDDMMKYLVATEHPEIGDISKLRIEMTNASNLAIKYALSMHILLYDLRWLLLKAPTGQEFITSDTPVLFANPFLPDNHGASTTGFPSKGLVIAFPLTPTLTLILFDSDVYRLHGHADDAATIQAKEDDVLALNKLQCASCYDNVYFSRPDMNVQGLLAQAVRYRRAKKNQQRIFPKEDSPERKSEIIMSMQVGAKMPLVLSFLRPRKQAERWRKEFLQQKRRPVVVIRNRFLHQVHEEYIDRARAGEAMPHITDFLNEALRAGYRSANPYSPPEQSDDRWTSTDAPWSRFF